MKATNRRVFITKILVIHLLLRDSHTLDNYGKIGEYRWSSKCFDDLNRVNLHLVCPTGYHIQTLTAFTAISQNNTCSYQHQDCILQEGSAKECNKQTHCRVQVTYTPVTNITLYCGEEASVQKYVQIEYECIEDYNNTTMNANEATATQHENKTTKNEAPQANSVEALREDKPYTLVLVICGCVMATLVVVGVIVSAATKVKKRAGDQIVTAAGLPDEHTLGERRRGLRDFLRHLGPVPRSVTALANSAGPSNTQNAAV